LLFDDANDAENHYTQILEKAKKTKDRAHKELQIQDEFECMCLALHFYQWLAEYNDNRAQPECSNYIFKGEDLLYTFMQGKQAQDNKYTQDKGPGEYKKEDAALVVWWIQMALNFMNAYRGKCTRYLNIDLEEKAALIDYFQIGKVFNWPNFTLALRNIDDQPPTAKRPWNVRFHIFGYNCKMLARVPGEGRDEVYETVMFRPNSQFMVCKVEKKADNNDGTKVEVWVREVQLGLSQCNVLWIDENIFTGDNEDQFSSWVRYNCDHLNIKLIMKTSSKSAWSYINSQAFRKSVKYSEQFKVIINKTCYVDVDDPGLPYPVQQPWHSGPRFIQWFIMKGPQKELKPELYKVKMLLSGTSKEDAKRAMQECGLTI